MVSGNCVSIFCYVTLLLNSLPIYSRIFGDLVMWEPSAPSPVDFAAKATNPYESVHINLASHIGQLDSTNVGGDKFFMCRSALKGDSMFYSCSGEKKMNKKVLLKMILSIDSSFLRFYAFLDNVLLNFNLQHRILDFRRILISSISK